MNVRHHIEELRRKIDRIAAEPIRNYMKRFKEGKATKIDKIRTKIRNLEKLEKQKK